MLSREITANDIPLDLVQRERVMFVKGTRRIVILATDGEVSKERSKALEPLLPENLHHPRVVLVDTSRKNIRDAFNSLFVKSSKIPPYPSQGDIVDRDSPPRSRKAKAS